jgi:uncharacterized membrane protein YkvI
MKLHRNITALLVICSILCVSMPAGAEQEPWDEVFIWATIMMVECGIAAVGSLSLISNGIHIHKEERPSGESQFMGYFFGSLSVLAGVAMLFTIDEEKEIPIGFGTASILYGGAVIGVTIWASTMPEKKEQKLTLSPIIMPDARGQPAVGIGLRLVGW